MNTAYVFVQIGAADPREVISAIQEIEGVKQAHIVAGPIDCIAFVEGIDLDALGETIVAIRTVDGVAGTDTRIVWPM